MTEEELSKIEFRCVSHLSLANEHCMTYSSNDGRLGFCDHVPYRNGQPYGRSYRHYRIKDKTFKKKEKFLEALKDVPVIELVKK